jgi:hypothetical protein
LRSAAGYPPQVGYVDQFDNLVREQDRGRSIRNTRTIAVFDDGLVVCVVPVPGSPGPQLGPVSRVILGRRYGQQAAQHRGPAQIRDAAAAMGAAGRAHAFAQSWAEASALPFEVITRVVLRRPRQISELSIEAETTQPDKPERLVFLGDLSAARVRDLLGPRLGDRLVIEVPD